MNLTQCIETHMQNWERDIRTKSVLKDNKANLYDEVMDVVEKSLMAHAMAYCGYKQIMVAKVLDMNRNTVRKLLKKHGLHEELVGKYHERVRENGRNA